MNQRSGLIYIWCDGVQVWSYVQGEVVPAGNE